MLTLAQDVISNMFSMPIVVFTVGGAVGIIAILAGSITSITVNRARERTKREIAAYVAEGSLDADKAIQMLKAANTKHDG
jgi:hypothetical protein